jgi:hypothetical protein
MKEGTRRAFINHLLLAHGHRTTKRTPTLHTNELIDVVLVLDRSLDAARCAKLQEALETRVLVARRRTSTCTRLDFPCRFFDLERQIFAAAGQSQESKRPEPSARDRALGVNASHLLSILPEQNRRLLRLLLDHEGMPVPDDLLLEEGFQAKVEADTRDRGMGRLRYLLRFIGLDMERVRTLGWRLIW